MKPHRAHRLCSLSLNENPVVLASSMLKHSMTSKLAKKFPGAQRLEPSSQSSEDMLSALEESLGLRSIQYDLRALRLSLNNTAEICVREQWKSSP